MEILGVGWQEFIFILIIAIIVLGPKDMQKAGRTIGRWLNQLVHSDSWKVFQKTSSELRNLPRNLMREANMEMMETEKEIRRAIDPRPNPPASSRNLPPSKEEKTSTQGEPPAENTGAPAAAPKSRAAVDGDQDGAESTSKQND
jgi:sec-independent protein translocase protein TatB